MGQATVRIALFHNQYARRGGEDVAVEVERDALRAAGHEVSVCLVSSRALADGPWTERARAGWAAPWSRAAYARVREHLRRTRAEVGHLHNDYPGFGPALVDAHRDEGVPLVRTLHNYRLVCARGTLWREGAACRRCPDGSRLQAIPRRCGGSLLRAVAWARAAEAGWRTGRARAADAYVAPSRAVAELHVALGLPRARVHVVPHGCPDPFPRGAPPPRAEGGALYVGRLAPEKGVDLLLRAWRGVAAPLRIAGTGPEERSLRRLAGPRVELLGELSRDQVAARLADAALLVTPHRWIEPFGLVVIEAFAAGRPVVTAALGGPAETVEHGRTGWIVPPEDPAALRAAVGSLLADPARLARMGAAARAAFEERHRAAHQAAALTAVFEGVLARTGHDERRGAPGRQHAQRARGRSEPAARTTVRERQPRCARGAERDAPSGRSELEPAPAGASEPTGSDRHEVERPAPCEAS